MTNGDESGEEIIELTDIIMDAPDTGASDDIIDLTDIVEKEEKEISSPSFHPTAEQVEAALEKVIEKQFADKIQTILFQVMERVIEKEIAEIRESLQKDLDQIGKA
ncbi:MAG: hypothetical protein A3J80_02820 [Desulfobacula sp. RIFOXYB2_FULL_45_6]|nr:MAG: hypothetical protein A3J80_02820 [Desulfobacula sp. RIFOXYB2_FULL_45_6]